MRTGKLVKLHRPGGSVHAYLYRDGSVWRAAVYATAPGQRPGSEPTLTLSADSDAEVEQRVRHWVDQRFPR